MKPAHKALFRGLILSLFMIALNPGLGENPAYAQGNLNDNDVRSFVFHVFALYDRQSSVETMKTVFAEEGLELQFGASSIKGWQGFAEWYQGVDGAVASSRHYVEMMDVKEMADGRYTVAMTVLLNAKLETGEDIAQRFDHEWILIEDKGTFKIRRYVVNEVPA